MVFLPNGSTVFKSLPGCTGAFGRLQTVNAASECPIHVRKTLDLRLYSPHDRRTLLIRDPDLEIAAVFSERTLYKIR